jgi:hypothetical protein
MCVGLTQFYIKTMERVQAKLEVSSLVSVTGETASSTGYYRKSKYSPEDAETSFDQSNCRPVDKRLLSRMIGFVCVAATPLSLKCLAELLFLESWRHMLTLLAPLFTLFPLKDPFDSVRTTAAAHEYCLVNTTHK